MRYSMKSIKMAGYIITMALISCTGITRANDIDEQVHKNMGSFLNAINVQDALLQKQLIDQVWNSISSMQKTGGKVPTVMPGLDNSIASNIARKFIDSVGAQIRRLKTDDLITNYLIKLHEELYAPIASKKNRPLPSLII